VTVHRLTPLPTAEARGHLVLPTVVAARTMALIAERGGNVGHEALVWWLGRQIGQDTVVVSCIAPAVDNGPQHVFVDEAAVGDAAALARSHRLGIVAQVHSHPGGDTRHSDGDDSLVLMPFESMFSIVVADYGAKEFTPVNGAGVHQFQDGRWVWVTDAAKAMVFVADELRQ
jgi:proteasome lid subunit RPN8/RPN11